MIYFLIAVFVGLVILAHLDGQRIVKVQRKKPSPAPAQIEPHRGTVIARWYHLGWQVSRVNHPDLIGAAHRWADVVLVEASVEIEVETINKAIEAGARIK